MESIWDNYKKDLIPKLLDLIGFAMEVKVSSISHPQAGNGVFIKNNSPVLPGTLLGFYPGVIYKKKIFLTKISSLIAKQICLIL